jgi:hypothetical protein
VGYGTGESMSCPSFTLSDTIYHLFFSIPDTISLNDSKNVQIYTYEYINIVNVFDLCKNTENITMHGIMELSVVSYSILMQQLDIIMNNGEEVTLSGFSNPLIDGSWVIEGFTYKVQGGFIDSFEYDMTLERA